MQQGDYASYYQFPHYQNPNPNPIPNSVDHHQQSNPYASAPPFSSNYSTPPPAPAPAPAPVPPPPPTATTDYSPYSQVYPPYPQNPDPLPPTPTAPQPQQPASFPPYDSHGPYQPPSNQSSLYFPPFDQHQSPPAYNPPAYSAPYNPQPAPTYGSNPYDNSVKYDQSMGYYDGGYNRSSRSDLGSDLYGDGVYAYEGGKVEPYGARGTAPKSSTWARFDDYGRPITVGDSGKESSLGSGSGSGSGSNSGSSKIVRAVPKAETQEDVKGGVQKFRVKLLAESSGQSTMDVLCQIGLDGIRMLDPSTSRTLRIYPIENITRCDVTDASTFAFWSKSSVDIEPRRIRLQSSRYTTNTLLDTVTAAIVQVKEIGGRSRPSEAPKVTEQSTERKKGLTDWMNIIKPGNEEKDHWVPDEAVSKCTACGVDFGAFNRRHHCRNCGDIFCDKCTNGRIALTADENAQPVRVCDRCLAEVTQRLSNAKEAASKPQGLQSHEDLARKLQEEMEKNRKAASGSKSDGSGKRMREVACPTCTVHLQVQVPSSGSETIECGVCQHPFLVSAH